MASIRLGPGIVLALVTVSAVGAWDARGPGERLLLNCSQPIVSELRCRYRIAGPARPLDSAASIGDLLLPSPRFAAGDPGPGSVLLTVEAGLLQGPPLVRERVLEHVRRITTAATGNLRFGLAVFGDTMEIVSPVGTDSQTMDEQLGQLEQRSPARVLLYRNVALATDLLNGSSARRRAIVLLATGRSDDRQVDHALVMRKALDRDTVLYAIAYPGFAAADEGESRLRQLSYETGGQFVATARDGTLAESFFDSPFSGLDNAGALSVDLSPALRQLPGGEYSVQIRMGTASSAVHATVPVFLVSQLAMPTRPIETTSPAVMPTPAGAVPIVRRQADDRPAGTFWLVALAIALLAIVAALLTGVLVFKRRPTRAPESRGSAARGQVRGSVSPCLVVTEGGSHSHPVTGQSFKIGRLSENDLVLTDPSVSRNHAELRLTSEGKYRIIDLESMNGVYVNGRRVRRRTLADGDELEIGDVRLSFEMRLNDPLERESTQVLDTIEADTSLLDTGKIRRIG